MLKIVLPFAVLWALIWQVPASAPIRTGDVARQLTQQDVNELKTKLPFGASLWLLNGDTGQDSTVYSIDAYLAPTTETAAVRRGSIVRLIRRIDPPTAWKVQSPNPTYAQVAIAGRNFNQIQGDDDVNRPFVVVGRFEDADLVKLVEFLRSSPSMGASNRVELFPLLTVGRQSADIVQVRTRGGAKKGQTITMRRDGQKWVLVSVSSWVA